MGEGSGGSGARNHINIQIQVWGVGSECAWEADHKIGRRLGGVKPRPSCLAREGKFNYPLNSEVKGVFKNFSWGVCLKARVGSEVSGGMERTNKYIERNCRLGLEPSLG